MRENGIRRDEQRVEQWKARDEAARLAEERGESPPYYGGPWSADLVVREEGGFELWLGSLEDALSLEALRERGVNGLLNCALESCLGEVACFQRPARGGRVRSHTRGASLLDESALGLGGGRDTTPALNKDQVWAVASFDDDWYSETLETKVAYHSFRADDEAGYEISQHFAEIIDHLAECRKDNRKVLVHCVMGVNRAPTATLAFLCGHLGMSLEAAIDQTSRARGHMLSNKTFIDQLIKHFGPGVREAEAAAGSGSAAEEAAASPLTGASAASAAAPGASALKTSAAESSQKESSPKRQPRQQVSFGAPPSQTAVGAR